MKKFDLKQQLKNYFDYNAIYTYVTLIFIEVLIVFWSYYTWSYHKDIGHWLSIDNNAAKFILLQIGLLLGVYIGIILLKKLVINRGFKVRSVLILSAIIIPLISIAISFSTSIFNSYFAPYFSHISWPKIFIETNSEIYFLLSGMLLGAMLGSALYLWISKSHNVTFVYGGIFLFLGFAEKNRHVNEFQIDGTTQAIAIVCLIIGVFLFIYLLTKKFKISRRELRQVFRIRYILVVIIFFIIALVITTAIFDDLRNKHELIERVKEEQRRLRELEQAGGGGGIGGIGGSGGSGDIDFGDRSVTIEEKVVGFYQAKSPLYLKINKFSLSQNYYSLSINKEYNSCTESSGYYYYGYDYEQNEEYGVAADSDKDTVRIIYANGESSVVPSTRNIVGFDKKQYCLSDFSDFLLDRRNTNRNSLIKTQFEYDWKKEQVLNESEIKYPEYYYNYYYDDDYVDEASDRYDEILALAKSITAVADSNLEKAKKIEQYFKANYYYSFNPGIADQDSPLDDFILDSKHGYCAHFASSMVMMLEMLGIDANLVGGFYSTEYNRSLDSYVMMSTDLHMWVEVLDYEKGWVKFDPTSSRCDESRDECGSLYGGGAGVRDYGGDIDVNIEYVLEPVNPTVSFDDLFDMSNSSGLGLDEGVGFNPETLEEMSGDYQERLEEIEKLEREREQREKQEEKHKEEKEKNWKLVGLIVLVVFILVLHLIVLVVAVFLIYKYWKHVDMRQFYQKQRDRKWVRRIDQKIRSRYWKQLQHIAASKEEYYDISSKDFLKALNKESGISAKMLELYRLINKVLYDKNYSPKDIQKIKDIDLL